MHFILSAILIVLAGSAFSGTKKVVLLHHHSDHRATNIAQNVAYIENLPVDGLEVEIPASWDAMMKGGPSYNYTQIYDQNLKLIQGIFTKVTYNWALIYYVGNYAPPDWFDNASWNSAINNWRLIARACKAAGLKGISFDNENYQKGHYDYPVTVDSSSKYSLDQYKTQARLRGHQLMQACVEEFPNIEVMLYHGPYLSEPKVPAGLFPYVNQPSSYELHEPFFTGFVEAAVGTPAYVHDGGEIYSYRTADEFNHSYKWRKDTIASAAINSPNIPSALRPYWSQKVKISFGVYKSDGDTPAMTPTVMRTTLENALRACDDYVWFYGNWNEQWLIPPGSDLQAWLPAISGARQAVNSGIYFTGAKQANVEAGSNFSFTITFDNFTGAAASITYVKKPSWITAVNGNPTITGTAPNTPSVDSVKAIVSAGGKSDTLNLAITVATYLTIEAESGTLVAPMEKGSDPAVSGGQYITTPAGTGNTIYPKAEATYSVNIPKAGAYYVWLRVYRQTINSAGNYGTFVGFNGTFGKPGIANRIPGQHEWIIGSPVFNLTAGANQLILGHGNEQVRIDKIIITNSSENTLPVSLTSSLPKDKKNVTQQKPNLSVRTVSDRVLEFTGNFGNGNPASLSIVDIAGRTVWTYQTAGMGFGNQIVWDTKVGNTEISNGLYFAVLKPENGLGAESKKIILIR